MFAGCRCRARRAVRRRGSAARRSRCSTRCRRRCGRGRRERPRPAAPARVCAAAPHTPVAERDADAGRAALERPEHQLAADVAIEADPVDVGQRSPRSAPAALAMLAMPSGSPATSPSSAEARSAVERRLVRRFDLEVVHQSQPHFPAPALTALRPFFSSTRFAFAALLGRVGLRLALHHMGLGDHFRQASAAHPRGSPPASG